jgi:regulator of replication initiation timing
MALFKTKKPVSPLNEQLNQLIQKNKQLTESNKALEQRIGRLERVVHKLFQESRVVRSKHGYLKEHVNNIANQLNTLGNQRRK